MAPQPGPARRITARTLLRVAGASSSAARAAVSRDNRRVHLLLRIADRPLVGDRRAVALELLSGAERSRFATARDPERFLTGRMLLRELVAELTGAELASITVIAACPDCGLEHGRPRVAEHPGIHLSLSHAGGRTLAAATTGAAIGVDLERRDISPDRLAAIQKVAGGDLAHWTRVEAVLKADGRGLRVDPRAVEVDGDHATLEGARYELTDASDDRSFASVARTV